MCTAHQRDRTNLAYAPVCLGQNTPAGLRDLGLLWHYVSASIPDFRTRARAKKRLVSRGMPKRAEAISRRVDLGSSGVDIRWLEVAAEDACSRTHSRFPAGLLTSQGEREAQVSLPMCPLRSSCCPELFSRRVAMSGRLPSRGFPVAAVW